MNLTLFNLFSKNKEYWIKNAEMEVSAFGKILAWLQGRGSKV